MLQHLHVCYTQDLPSRVAGMLAYQTLIFEASLEYEGSTWLAYDHHFHQHAATNLDTPWA